MTPELYGDSTQLLYLRARHYSPADGRFTSRDTWNGDVNRPLSLNRWMYVEGNPINRMDPSGNWYCTGVPDCEDWIEKALNNLKKLDPQIVNDFERYDQRLTMMHAVFRELTAGRDLVDPSRDIYLCDLSTIGFRFTFRKMDTFGAITRPTHIDIDQRLSNPNQPTTIALLGHEFYHLLRQSVFVATTIYGELLAAQYEASLILMQGVSLPSQLKPPNYDQRKGVLAMNPNYGPDLIAYRDFTPYPWYEPLYPMGINVAWPQTESPECVEVSSGQPLACRAPMAQSRSPQPESTSTPQP